MVVPFSQGDGTCEFCRNGYSNICSTPLFPGFTYWGGYGRLVAVPFADLNLVPLPGNIDFVEAASMGCRFMTSFHGIVDRAQVKPGEWVAVHGCGGIGLSAINIAAAVGANVIGVDLDDRKLELAKKLARRTLSTRRRPIRVSAILDLTARRRARRGRCARNRSHLPQFDHEPAQAGPASADRAHDLGGEGRNFDADRSDGAFGVAVDRHRSGCRARTIRDAADGRSAQAHAQGDGHFRPYRWNRRPTR